MSLLFRVVYAAHASGTHHKLALDGLRHLGSPEAERWQRLFLEQVALYMEGAKAPDTEFKDFRNHVLHVRDGYWGGAVDKVESWYGRVVEELAAQRWSEAVYAAGILSHYVTDPIHPFHTAQSEAENNIHRACEWSISKSYDELRRTGEACLPALELSVGEGDAWLRDLVCRGAEIANANYERLIAHYDIHRGVVDPPAGLDAIAKGLVADLLVYAARVHGAVLDRAFKDSGATPPDVNLTLDTLLATLKIPAKWVTRKLADAGERRLVERMYDELKTTGRVEANLPADDRMVRDLHRAEVLGRQAAAMEEQRARVVARKPPVPQAATPTGAAKTPPASAGGTKAKAAPAAAAQPVRELASLQKRAPAASSGPSMPEVAVAATKSLAASLRDVTEHPPLPQPTIQPQPTPLATVPAISAAPVRPAPPAGSVPSIGQAAGVRLAAGDALEKAPSIGPKTAERFAAIGIVTVSDFLAAEPAAAATKIDNRHITAEVVGAWQDQTRLVMSVPGLRGTHAQLLVGAGYRTVDAIASADPDTLCAGVLTFATSADGQRVLREGSPPDVGRIKSWCEAARQAKAA